MELLQQLAAGGKSFTISRDGAAVELAPLTNHAHQPIAYEYSDLLFPLCSYALTSTFLCF